ncbi:MAG: hypothetical protein HUK22_01450 [Thermoguttaceae bacterium]|nr:hypothetical protein [Thermoguttaceae bacterium]
MNINGINGAHGVSAAQQVAGVRRNGAARGQATVVRDEMEFTAQATTDARAAAGAGADIRVDKVNEVRAQIAAEGVDAYIAKRFPMALEIMLRDF